jgi:signal transduction histidine kinase
MRPASAGCSAVLERLSAALVHEIRQPLNGIRLVADGLLFWHEDGRETPVEELYCGFQEIAHYVERLDGILQHMPERIRALEREGEDT